MRGKSTFAWPWVVAIAALRLLVHLLVADQYGFHRDEFLYLAQTEHLAWGFLEVPPALAALGAVIRLVGDDILWIKLLPALTGAAMVMLTAKMAADLGGSKWAQIIAAVTFAIVPSFLRTHHLFQPVFLNQFLWTLLTFFVIRLELTRNKYYWYAIGLTIGAGLLTKYSMAFPAAGLFIGLVLTPSRHWLNKKETWLAAAAAVLIFWPNLVVQYDHNWPVIHHMRELRETQLVNVRPMFFVGMQFIMLLTASLLWAPGVISFFTQKMKPFRVVVWMYLTTITILLIMSGKPYYSLGMYPVLIAAGAVWWNGFLIQRQKWKPVLDARNDNSVHSDGYFVRKRLPCIFSSYALALRKPPYFNKSGQVNKSF